MPSPVKQLALKHGLPVLQPEKITLDAISGLQADLMIVVAYGQILRQDVLNFPAHGCLNVHASLLPRWRGAAPIQRAILAGDKATGTCIMQMDAGLDTGDVLARSEVEITPDDNAQTLTRKLAGAGIADLLAVLEQIANQTLSPEPQVGEALYAHKIRKEEAQIDWHSTADLLDRVIRCFNPDPVAYTHLNDMRIRIWEASPVNSSLSGRPGEVLALDKSGLTVACGEGALLITRIQLPLGKGSVLTPADLLNARREMFLPGTQFSSQ